MVRLYSRVWSHTMIWPDTVKRAQKTTKRMAGRKLNRMVES